MLKCCIHILSDAASTRSVSCVLPDAAKTLFPEPRSSLAILRGGYNLDSFMVRYQGVDWTNEANWECNARCCLPLRGRGREADMLCLQSHGSSSTQDHTGPSRQLT